MSRVKARIGLVATVMTVLGGQVGCGLGSGHPSARPAITAASPPAGPAVATGWARADEGHLSDLRPLTLGGENAEAYWSPDGRELVFQARPADDTSCDRIYRVSTAEPALPLPLPLPLPVPVPVSSGAGATTCGFFLPGGGGGELIFSSTHLAGASCPPRPDRSHGYVWAIHPAYDIFRATTLGGSLRRLTETPGYDAEATVCSVDGSIVFTSVRDGDLELYRMDADGKNVRRLTHEVGYDGGAFFDRDCSHIVWRASRPRVGPEREEYEKRLREGLVHPSKLELWVADADGGNPMQITYLDAASFAPSFAPSSATTSAPAPSRIVFSSNYGDPAGREFDLWAIDVTGTNLERVTTAPGFDGFPMFSPDGKRLAFSSNRATAPGRHDTNVFIARWSDTPARRFVETAADRILGDVRYLADPAREGRGIGTAGLAAAAAHIETRWRELGLSSVGSRGGYRQPFQVPLRVGVGPGTRLGVNGAELPARDFLPAAFSTEADVRGPLVLAGYGIVNPAAGVDDYAGVDAKGKLVVVRRFAPEGPSAHGGSPSRQAGDVRRKAFVAREHGAIGLLVVDSPLPPQGKGAAGVAWKVPDEAALPPLRAEGYGDAGLPVVFVRRASLAATLARLEAHRPVTAFLKVALTTETSTASNVVARVRAEPREGQRLPGVVVVGAHYDHLGLGESYSLEPGARRPHLGADDNASGTATLLEIARILASRKGELRRDVVLAAFSGEEEGVLGSTAFTRAPPGELRLSEIVAMVNLDMVGRLRGNRVTVLGRNSAAEWPTLLATACAAARIECTGEAGSGDGFGPSDQMPFYAAGIPVVHFFTGSHPDYHRPSDTAEKINAAGAGQIAVAAASLIEAVAARPVPLTVTSPATPPGGAGDMRTFGASLGSIPDYAGPSDGRPGVLLAGVRVGGAAEQGGLRRGDILVRLGEHEIRSVEDLMYALGASHPGQTVDAVVDRAGQSLRLPVTFQGPRLSPDGAARPH